jgi:hypothetical protein
MKTGVEATAEKAFTSNATETPNISNIVLI